MGDEETYEITALIRRLHRESKYTIVLIEHDMRVVFHLADLHHRARPGEAACRRNAEGDRGVGGGAGSLSRGSRMTRARGRRPANLLRQEPHPARRQPDGRRGQDHRAARTQRRRQDHDAAQSHGPDPGARGQHQDLRDRSHAHADLPGRRDSASAMCRKAASIFANLSVEDNLRVPLERPGPWTDQARLPDVSAARGAPGQSRPPTFRRRAGNALDRPGRCCSIPSCCCSMSRARVWRR